MRYFYIFKLLGIFLLLLPMNAYAYLGPGLGAGAIGAILGVLASVFVALFAIVYYPIKRMLKRKKARKINFEQNPPSVDNTGDSDGKGSGL